MQAIYNALTFLIHIVFNLFIFVLIMRVLLQWAGAHYFNPATQFTVKLTDWIVKPFKRILPTVYRIDLATVVIIFIVEVIEVALLTVVQISTSPLYVLLDPIRTLINIFFFAIIIRALFSWFSPQVYNPIMEVIYLITEPLLRPARKLIPPFSGIDISPIVVLIILKLIEIIFIAPFL